MTVTPLRTVEDADRDRRLSAVVESASGAELTPERTGDTADTIRVELVRLNREFAHYAPEGHPAPEVELRSAVPPA
ncbi:hypothetical protein [Actinoplanes sp. G11-F43]|uniref:hypothetical protein n=1 Tax=Actinoplanes sp. G11-F43 TaxID=3424130 RepID=UPI003D33840F